MSYKVLALEKCPCCSEIYFFFLHDEEGKHISCLGVRSRQEAFRFLNDIKELTEPKIVIGVENFWFWVNLIKNSLLPEYTPDEAVCRVLGSRHKDNAELNQKLRITIGLVTFESGTRQ